MDVIREKGVAMFMAMLFDVSQVRKTANEKEIVLLQFEELYPSIFSGCTVGNSRVQWQTCRLIEKRSWLGFGKWKCSFAGLPNKAIECNFQWCKCKFWCMQRGFNNDEREQVLLHNNTLSKLQARVGTKRCC